MIRSLKVILLSSALLLTGCVTGTRNISLELPAQSNQKAAVGNIQIIEINDNRVFEQKPSSPRTPSSKAKLDSVSADTKATLIGRQRNGYGRAMGDVALPDGSTVNDEVRKLVSAGLLSRGYTIVDDSDNKLTVDIEKFWAWMVPSMFTVGFESEVETVLTLSREAGSQTQTASGGGNNEGQIASDANWSLTYKRAFSAYLLELEKALEGLGL